MKPSLASILCNNVNDEKIEINIGGRFANRPMIISPMSTGDILEHTRIATERMNGFNEPQLNNRKYIKSILCKHLLDPSPKEKAVLEEVGAASQDEFIFDRFYPNELTKIIAAINEASGTVDSMEDMEEMIKKL